MAVTRWVAIAVVAAGAGMIWLHYASAPVVEPSAPLAPVSSGPVPSMPPVAIKSELSGAVAEASLSEQIQALAATRDPAKLFRAYRLLSECESFNRDHDRLIFDQDELRKAPVPGSVPGFRGMTEPEKQHDAKLCGPMTERDRLSRLDYLAVAAAAGVPEAAVAFAREGPFGDPGALATRPNDPLVQTWKAQARSQLQSAAETGGDMSAIEYLAGENYNGSELFEKSQRQAYRYNLAQGLIYSDMYGPDFLLAKLHAENSEAMAALAQDLSPQERATELAAAQSILKNFRDLNKPGKTSTSP